VRQVLSSLKGQGLGKIVINVSQVRERKGNAQSISQGIMDVASENQAGK
jgi:negative regulator of sigma E activity